MISLEQVYISTDLIEYLKENFYTDTVTLKDALNPEHTAYKAGINHVVDVLITAHEQQNVKHIIE